MSYEQIKDLPSALFKRYCGVKPDTFHKMVAVVSDQSTPEDAIKILGQPKKDKVDRLMVYQLGRWVSKKQKEKVFRNLEFKLDEKQGVQKATASFLDDKLVMLTLDLKSGAVAPNGLSNIYGIQFQPMVGAMDIAFNPRQFEQNQGKIYPKTYPTVYSLVAASEKTFIGAMIGNVPSFMGALGKSMGMPDEPGSFPGKVEFVQIISRTLENRDGADVLK
jgi:hypothetical protein